MLSGITAVLFVCGCVYRSPPADFYAANEWSEWSVKVRFLTKLRRVVDTRPWKVKGFAMWVLAHSFILFAYFVPYVHLVSDIPIHNRAEERTKLAVIMSYMYSQNICRVNSERNCVYTYRQFTYIHIYIHAYIHTYILTYIHTYIQTYVHTYVHIRTYVHTYIQYIHTYIQTYVHTYVHIHTYVRTYIHTYIHTVMFGVCGDLPSFKSIFQVPKT